MPEQIALKIPKAVWHQMAEHALEDAPREAVGLLGGPTVGVVHKIAPLPNLAGPLAFFADPYAQFNAEKALRAESLIIVGYYHSHPGGGLALSNEDRLFASRRDWTYVLIATGLHGERKVRTAAYRWLNNDIREVPLILIPATS